MSRIYTELDSFAQWPSSERTAALKRLLPRDVLRRALAASVRPSRFCRRLPGWFMLWFIVGIGVCCRDSYRQVFKWLQPYRRGGTPPRSTLCMARQRLGIAPVRWLAEHVAGLLASRDMAGCFYRGYRLMGIDGFVVDLADTPDNDRLFGRPKSGRGLGAFPQARVLSLCELGTHLLWRNQIKPMRRGEVTMAPALLRYLEPDMLLLWDRNFFSYALIHQVVVERRAQLLARVKKNLILRPIRRLADGSYLANVYQSDYHRRHDLNGIRVRIIEYTLTDPNRPGCQEKHRLLTTLLDETVDPAVTLVVLYHERWEEEVTIDELKTHQRERPVLRSQTPAGVVQEIYGLLLAHALIRRLMVTAATQAAVPPRRISFTGTLKVLRCRLAECPSDTRGRTQWYERLIAEVAEEVLPERRPRYHPRVIKKPISHWPKKRPEHIPKDPPNKRFHDIIRILN